MLSILKQYLWAFNLFAILLSSYFGAKLVNLYLESKIAVEAPTAKQAGVATPEASAGKTQVPYSAYEVILKRNIFDSSEATAETAAPVVEETVPSGEPVQTTLSIKVLGVLVVGDGTDDRSSATISGGAGGKDETYAVGDENGFAPSTKLTKVQPDRIEFVHNGRLEFALVNEEFGGSIFGPPPTSAGSATAEPTAPGTKGEAIKQEGEGKYVIDQAEVQNALTNVEQLYTDIRAVPNFAGGKVLGMKILSVKQGSIFDKLGLRRGDILLRINGLDLDVKRGFEIFNQLKTEKNLTLDLVRQGANQTVEYEIR